MPGTISTEKGTVPMYNLNAQRISPAALLQPNDLVTRTHRRARMAAILRDQRLQVTTDTTGAVHARLVQAKAA